MRDTQLIIVTIVAIIVLYLSTLVFYHSGEKRPFIIGVPNETAPAYLAVPEQANARELNRNVYRKDKLAEIFREDGLSQGAISNEIR
jgi:hypothetical protein